MASSRDEPAIDGFELASVLRVQSARRHCSAAQRALAAERAASSTGAASTNRSITSGKNGTARVANARMRLFALPEHFFRRCACSAGAAGASEVRSSGRPIACGLRFLRHFDQSARTADLLQDS